MGGDGSTLYENSWNHGTAKLENRYIHTDRQTDRLTDTHIDRQKYRQTDKLTYWQTDRQTDRRTDGVGLCTGRLGVKIKIA